MSKVTIPKPFFPIPKTRFPIPFGYLKARFYAVPIPPIPFLKKPLEFLENQAGINFVKMTGSGSCFVAYSKSRNSIINSFKKFRKNYPKYWSVLSKTI